MVVIGKLAQHVGVTPDTVRYYEKAGLLAPSGKTEAGYRLYNTDAVRRLQFIRQAQQCGFSLHEIGELLTLKNSDEACCKDVRNVAIDKKLQLEHKIRALQQMSSALGELITTCNDETRSLDACPILAALENSMARNEKGPEDA